MSNTLARRVIEAALRRRVGMTQEAAEKLRAHNASVTDWHGLCARCGYAYTGTLADMAKPCGRCGFGAEGK